MRYPTLLCACLLSSSLGLNAAETTPIAPASPTPAATPAVLAPVTPTKPSDLFNSKDFAGWEYVAGTPADITSVCTVKDGVIAVTGKPNGYLSTTTAYANYTLHTEWRWTDSKPNPSTNGGILINLSSGPVQQALWPTSFQVQLKVQRAGDVLNMGPAKFAETPTTAGTANSPSSTLARKADASEKPLGEWNTADVTVRGDTLEISINGVTQNKLTGCVPSSGKIGFQLEGYPFELRNVKLAPLPAAKP